MGDNWDNKKTWGYVIHTVEAQITVITFFFADSSKTIN